MIFFFQFLSCLWITDAEIDEKVGIGSDTENLLPDTDTGSGTDSKHDSDATDTSQEDSGSGVRRDCERLKMTVLDYAQEGATVTDTYFYDTDVITVINASGPNVVTDNIYIYRYIENVLQTLEIDDRNNSKIVFNTFDKNENVLRSEGWRDGEYLSAWIETYDEHNNKLTVKYIMADATVVQDYSSVWTYTLDDRNNVLTESEDNSVNGYGSADGMQIYTYDKRNNMLSKSFGNQDGKADSVYTYEWTSFDKLSVETTDYNADGLSDSFSTYTYNVNNNVVLREDTTYNGTVVFTMTYTYETCP